MSNHKYKIWIPEIKQMHEVISIRWDVCDSSKIKEVCSRFDRRWWRFEQVVLLQYTGLKDRSGKEVYEGDIVKFQSGHVGTVEKILESFKFRVGRITYYICMHDSPFHPLSNPFEIIGNIYENPELLEASE